MYFYYNTRTSEYICEECSSPFQCPNCDCTISYEYEVVLDRVSSGDFDSSDYPLGIECIGCGRYLLEPDPEYCGECEESPCECEPDEDSDMGTEVVYTCDCCDHDPCRTSNCSMRKPKQVVERPVGSVNLEDYLEDE